MSRLSLSTKVSESVYQGTDEANIFSTLMNSLLDQVQQIPRDLYKNAIRKRNEGLKGQMSGIVNADYEISKGPLTYGASKDYQSAAAEATEAVKISTGISNAAERSILADEVKLAQGDIKKTANTVKTNLKNIANLEGVKMADETLNFTKDMADTGVLQSFVGGVASGVLGQMKQNIQTTGKPFLRQESKLYEAGEADPFDPSKTLSKNTFVLGTTGMFGGRPFEPYKVGQTKRVTGK
jgi:CII-binding regulator of phage lambda lysogenization HflD